jgi:hypothetical protein
VTEKPLLTSVLPIGAKPVDNSGQTAYMPTTTFVESIWSEEYCRQHPQNAAEAIKSLQTILGDRDEQVAALKHAIKDIRKLLDERL